MPPTALAKSTLPPAPNFTVTRFGITCPAPKFRFDAFGFGVPVGNTVKNDPSVASVTVTFITTAVAAAGTFDPPPKPVTCNDLAVGATTIPANPLFANRESKIRSGVTA